MPEQRGRQTLHMCVEFSHQRETLVGDAHFDDAPILAAAGARDEAPFGETVDEPRDIGITLNHALRNIAAGEPGRMRSAQNPKHVVLIRGELGGRLEELRPRLDDSRRGDSQAEQDFLFRRREGCPLFSCFATTFGTRRTLSVATTIVERFVLACRHTSS